MFGIIWSECVVMAGHLLLVEAVSTIQESKGYGGTCTHRLFRLFRLFSMLLKLMRYWILSMISICSVCIMYMFLESTRHWKHLHLLGITMHYQPSPIIPLYNCFGYNYSIGNPLFSDDGIDPQVYGVDNPDSDCTIEDLTEVFVPVTISLSENSLQTLQTEVDPLCNSDSYGADVFMHTVTLVKGVLYHF